MNEFLSNVINWFVNTGKLIADWAVNAYHTVADWAVDVYNKTTNWWAGWTSPTWQKIAIVVLIAMIAVITLANVIGAISLAAKNRRARAAAKAAAKAAAAERPVVLTPGWRIVVTRKAGAGAGSKDKTVAFSEQGYAAPRIVYPESIKSCYEGVPEEHHPFREFDERLYEDTDETDTEEGEEGEEGEEYDSAEPELEFDYEPARPEPLSEYAYEPAEPEPEYAYEPAEPEPEYAYEPAEPEPEYAYEPAEPEIEDNEEYDAAVEQEDEPAFGGAEYSAPVEEEHRPTPEEQRLSRELDQLNARLAMLTDKLSELENAEKRKEEQTEYTGAGYTENTEEPVYEEPVYEPVYEEHEEPSEESEGSEEVGLEEEPARGSVLAAKARARALDDDYDLETDHVEVIEHTAEKGAEEEAPKGKVASRKAKKTAKNVDEETEEENSELENAERSPAGSKLPEGYEDMDEPEEALTIEDEDGEVTEMVKRVDYKSRIAVVVRYRKSFTAKLIQCSDETKAWYAALKNEFLSYKKVKSRVSWKYDSINLGRVALAKFAIRGKTLCLYLALDPKEFKGTRYKVETDESRRFEEVPCMYRIKNRKRMKYAMQLFALVAERNTLKRSEETQTKDYYLPYEHSVELLGRNLIKEVYSRESLDDFLQKRENSVKANLAARARKKEVRAEDDDDEDEIG